MMRDMIDLCNHILLYTDVYYEGEDVTDDVREDALNLCMKYGDDFCIGFIENYLQVSKEEYSDSL